MKFLGWVSAVMCLVAASLGLVFDRKMINRTAMCSTKHGKLDAVRISDLFLCCNVWCFCVFDRKNEMQIAGSVFQDVWTMLLLLNGCLFWSCRVLVLLCFGQKTGMQTARWGLRGCEQWLFCCVRLVAASHAKWQKKCDEKDLLFGIVPCLLDSLTRNWKMPKWDLWENCEPRFSAIGWLLAGLEITVQGSGLVRCEFWKNASERGFRMRELSKGFFLLLDVASSVIQNDRKIHEPGCP